MRVGVTGASGFIGRRVVAALQRRGDEAVALVRDPRSMPECETRPFDLAQPMRFATALVGLEGIVHAAAHVPKSYGDPNEARTCLEVNALGTLALLHAAAAVALRRAVVYSGNVYRVGSSLADEDAPIYPSAQAPYYLISKACADFYADAVLREGKLGIAILRPAAVYGPGLTRGMIATFTSRLAAGETLTVADGGRYRADLVYVDDVAEAAVAAVHATVNGPFNLGSGVTWSSLEIAEELARIMAVSRDLIAVEEARPGPSSMGFSPLDIRRAREAFGYVPRSPPQGLADYVAWWRTIR